MSTTPGFLLLFFLLLPLLLLLHSAKSQPYDDYTNTANLSSKWTNSPNLQKISYPDGSLIRVLLMGRNISELPMGLSFACGFYCSTGTSTTCDSNFLFGIYIMVAGSLVMNSNFQSYYSDTLPHVVWSANRNRPIKENATLEFTGDGDLILKDEDGIPVWSTGTSGKSVAGMNLTESGNLMLVGKNGKIVWQSFHHPTDTMLPGQKLMEGQKLTANTSTTNFTEGQYYLSVTSSGWKAYIDSTPPQLYYDYSNNTFQDEVNDGFIEYTNGSINISRYHSIVLPKINTFQYLRLEFDGHLRIYNWGYINGNYHGWEVPKDLTDDDVGACSYPTICGNYGICKGTQCICPHNANESFEYFKYLNREEPNRGCAQITPLSCQDSRDHGFLIMSNIYYFNFIEDAAFNNNLTTEESCKNSCLHNCSCKAAFFIYFYSNASDVYCLLISQLFSMRKVKRDSFKYNSTAYIKVQNPQAVYSPPKDSSPKSKFLTVGTIVGSVFGALLGLSLVIGVLIFFIKRRNRSSEEEDEDRVDQLPGMTIRFSYEELKVATNNFLKKLGEGGFGSVFEGTLTDGTRIAVKRLDNVGQGKREFLSEVETIGSIHHVNLVRLVGFCTWKSHKLLVYEYMSNKSLDKWIFQKGKSNETQLDWKTKCKIINHVAKGLLYLHEDCRQRIAHMDIKPQNILLDQNFDAKVSDFGLSKLIDKDQSAIMTRMRGTPGYLAPEWLTSLITEKVDIYSFGVVIIEVVCGRKNLDHSLPEESQHLLKILMQKAQQGNISDFVKDYSCQSVEVDQNEVDKMLRLAIWCLQVDTDRRPSISSVVKVLEGSLDVDSCLNFNMWTITQQMELKCILDSSNQSAPL